MGCHEADQASVLPLKMPLDGDKATPLGRSDEALCIYDPEAALQILILGIYVQKQLEALNAEDPPQPP